MKDSTSKIVGKSIAFLGCCCGLYGYWNKNNWIVLLSGFVILFGKTIIDYWDDWFN